MPDKVGRFTAKESVFVQQMARTNDATYAATKAGYAFPDIIGAKLKNHPLVMGATREVARKFLEEKAGAIGVFVIAEVALDPHQPGNTRVNAGKALAVLSGIAVKDADSEKAPHEMAPGELNANIHKLRQQLNGLESAKADAARPVIDAETGVFD